MLNLWGVEDIRKYLKECDKKVSTKSEQLRKEYTMVILRLKCISNDNYRTFLLLISNDSNNILPELHIFHDNLCAYCGAPLHGTDNPTTCIACGRTFDDNMEKLICKNGHYICQDCYIKEALKDVVILLENLFANYERIKEQSKNLEEELSIGEWLAFRNSILMFFNRFSKEYPAIECSIYHQLYSI